MSIEQARPSKALHLFATKTRVPLPPPNFVSRSRLVAPLRAGLTRKLTIVTAPAGFGKTTLVAELAREVGADAAWLALDPGDYDVSVFAHYLIEAVAQVRPGFGGEARDWLASTPALATQIDDFVAIFLGELEAAAGDCLVLFLDDYHEVNESDSITRLVDTLLRYLPPHIHLLISGRTAPAFTFTRLLVQQQVGGLGTEDLRFRIDEAGTWLTLRSGHSDPAGVQRIIDVTEGWAAGMLLQATADVGALQPGASSDQLYAYLSSEVLERQPPEIQHFLLRAALLSHLTVSLVKAVLEIDDAETLLRRIQDQQLFLTVTGASEGPSYRLHQLFREFLSKRLQVAAPQEFLRLHRKAAAYYVEQGDYSEAMEHLFAGADWERAATLAARVGPAELDAGRTERVEHWLARFPDDAPQRWPVLLLLRARWLTTQGQYEQAGDLLARAEYLLQQTEDRAGYAEALVLRGRLAVAHGNGPQIIEFAQKAIVIAEATPTTRAQACHVAAVGYTFTREAAAADAAYTEALAAFAALGDLQGMAVLTSDWGYSLVMRQELSRAAVQLERALNYAREAGNRRYQARVLSNLAAVYKAHGDLRLAQDYLAEALEIARQLRWRRVEAEILAGQADNALILEGPRSALRLYQESAIGAREAAPITWVQALAGQASCLRRLGRYSEATRVARQGLDAAQAAGMVFEEALCQLELGSAMLVHSPEEALPLLHRAERTIVTFGRNQEVARVAAALAMASVVAYDYAGAEESLSRAAAAAEAVGDVLFLAPELATGTGLPLLRYADRGSRRYANLLTAATQYLATESQESGAERPRPDSPLHLVHGRPRVLEVYSFGPIAVYCDGMLLARSDWQTTTAMELFFYLVEHPDGLRKEQILAAFWPDHAPKAANENFHTSLRRLRGALGAEVVKVDGSLYRLNPALALWHDGAEVLALIERARQAPDPVNARRHWEAAATLLRGSFAEEFYREWAGERRQFWETRTKEVLSWLADDALRRDALDDAGTWAQRLLGVDPLDEAVHALLMRIYAAAGRQTLLVQQYNELRRVLEAELGAQPNPRTQALYQHLLHIESPRV